MAIWAGDALYEAIESGSPTSPIEFDESWISEVLARIKRNPHEILSYGPPNAASRQALFELETGESVQKFESFADINTDDID